MKLERGMICYDLNGDKWIIANTFMESEEVVTYRHYNKYRKRWIFYTEFTRAFMRKFEIGGWNWKLKKHQKNFNSKI